MWSPCNIFFAQQSDKKDPSNDIVKPWKDVGATVGWMKLETSGSPIYVEKPEADTVSSFRFPRWKDGGVTRLPTFETPYGVDLAKTEVAETGLEEPAAFRNLPTLILCETKVSEETVETRQKAPPKCFNFNR